MIVTKTPLRVSFFGGGSDLPEYFENHGPGWTLSCAIDKHVYIALNLCDAPHVRVIYSKLEQVDSVHEVKHDRVREALKYFGITSNVEIASFSDITTRGSGLGSSSTFTVGLLRALNAIQDNRHSPKKLVAQSYFVERNLCGETLGYQDAVAAVYGGMNLTSYTREVPFAASRLTECLGLTLDLFNHLLFFNTKIERKTTEILENQVANVQSEAQVVENMKKLASMAIEAKHLFCNDKLTDFGALLHDGWELKKSFSPSITNPRIDEMYETCIGKGALGGKLLGAGGGGYLMVFVPPNRQVAVVQAMEDMGYDVDTFYPSSTGSSVEMNSWN